MQEKNYDATRRAARGDAGVTRKAVGGDAGVTCIRSKVPKTEQSILHVHINISHFQVIASRCHKFSKRLVKSARHLLKWCSGTKQRRRAVRMS